MALPLAFNANGPENKFRTKPHGELYPFDIARRHTDGDKCLVSAKAGTFKVREGKIMCAGVLGEAKTEARISQRILITRSNAFRQPVSIITEPEHIQAVIIEGIEKFRARLSEAEGNIKPIVPGTPLNEFLANRGVSQGDLEMMAARINRIKSECLGISDFGGAAGLWPAMPGIAVVFSDDIKVPTLAGIATLSSIRVQLSDFTYNRGELLEYNRAKHGVLAEPQTAIFLGHHGIITFD